MASACVNNVGMAPDSAFLDFQAACPPYGWLGPRISLGREAMSDIATAATSGIAILKLAEGDEKAVIPSAMMNAEPGDEDLVLTSVDLLDFEFHLEDPVAMLPADELFFDGKLMPLQMPAIRPLLEREQEQKLEPADVQPREAAETTKIADRVEHMLRSDPYLQSPRAPRCSSRWRDLLGLRKQQIPISDPQKSVTSSSKNPNSNLKSLRQLLNRHQKIAINDPSLSLPLLRESDVESLSVSSRRSLSSSSSSSGGDHDDLPRLSLDSEKRDQVPISLNRPPPKVRLARQRPNANANAQVPARVSRNLARTPAEPPTPLAASVDSPRMNASGKVVFVGLERSSSSPGSFTGGSRAKYQPMERSYSAGVRVAPVLNVAVSGRSIRSIGGGSSTGSGFGFGQLFSPQKKANSSSLASTKR